MNCKHCAWWESYCCDGEPNGCDHRVSTASDEGTWIIEKTYNIIERINKGELDPKDYKLV